VWTMHAFRTKLEATVCAEMVRQGLPHEHRSLRFRVRDAAGGAAKYSPAIVARRGPILFLVEPMAVISRPAIERLTGFLDQHSPEIVLVIVASLSIFGRKLYLRIRYLFLAKGQERRWDHVPTRVKNFIVYGIFQRKVAREWYAGVLHSFIFWAFVILGASVVEITAQAYA